MPVYNCKICNFETHLKPNYERHLRTKKHLRCVEASEKEEENITTQPNNPMNPMFNPMMQMNPMMMQQMMMQQMIPTQTTTTKKELTNKELIENHTQGNLTLKQIEDDIEFDFEWVQEHCEYGRSATDVVLTRIKDYLKLIPLDRHPLYCVDKTRCRFYIRDDENYAIKSRDIWHKDTQYQSPEEMIHTFISSLRSKYLQLLIEVRDYNNIQPSKSTDDMTVVEADIYSDEKMRWSMLVSQILLLDCSKWKTLCLEGLAEICCISNLREFANDEL